MTRSARLALALSFGLLALSAPPAAAQTGAAARSRALFDQARQLAEAKKWSEACPLFQAAHDLNSTGGTALQAANCYEQINKLDRALELYRFILENPEARKKQDRVALAEERPLGRRLPHALTPARRARGARRWARAGAGSRLAGAAAARPRSVGRAGGPPLRRG